MAMVLTALVNVLLHRYSGQEDICVGWPVAGRPHPDLESQIGLFVNTVVLRSRLTSDEPFDQYLSAFVPPHWERLPMKITRSTSLSRI